MRAARRPYNPAQHGYAVNGLHAFNKIPFTARFMTIVFLIVAGPIVILLALPNLWRKSVGKTLTIVFLLVLGYGSLAFIPISATAGVLLMLGFTMTGYSIYALWIAQVNQQPMPSSKKPTKSDAIAFENSVATVFQNYGYKVETTPKSGDHGIDLRIRKDDERSVVQCKLYTGKVGEPDIRNFYGSMMHEGAQQGYFVTSSSFTESAQEWAKGKRIVLIDGKSFMKMMQESRKLITHPR